MSDPLISIVVLNYNRPELGSNVLKMLDKQEHKNFEVVLIDNGSDQPIPDDVISNLTYPINVLKLSKKMYGDPLNAALHLTKGKIIFPFFADDDFLLPCATRIIEYIFSSARDIHVLSLGNTNYDFIKNGVSHDDNRKFTGDLTAYPARKVAFH